MACQAPREPKVKNAAIVKLKRALKVNGALPGSMEDLATEARKVSAVKKA